MENASKALIIAGSILIAILLISVGVLIMNSTGNVQDQVQSSSDTMAIQTFNSQFTTYEGESVSASQVRALISLIKSSNASNGFDTDPADKKTDKYVYLYTNSKYVSKSSQVSANKTYTVTVHSYSTGGYVNQIRIKAN